MKKTADRNLKEFINLVGSYRFSAVILAAIESGIFSTLAGKKLTTGQLCKETGNSERGTMILLQALAEMGLVVKRGNLFSLSDDMNRIFNNPFSGEIEAAIMHHLDLYRKWSDISTCVRTGRRAKKGKSRRRSRWFYSAMKLNGYRRAVEIVNHINFKGVKKLLDVGGAPGIMAKIFHDKNPGMKITIIDYPEGIKFCKKFFATPGVNIDARLISGDIMQYRGDETFDMVTISNVIHIYSPEVNMEILYRIIRLLNPGGRIVIHDFLRDHKAREARIKAALFGVNMLVNTESGNAYSTGEIKGWMKKVGFSSIRVIYLDETGLLIGTKPY